MARWGERLAARHLEARGYTIGATNVRVGRAELDIVAVDPRGTAVVVEVKTIVARHPDDDPLTRADAEKLAVVRRAAARLEPPARRVDVVGVTIRRDGVAVRWVRDADW